MTEQQELALMDQIVAMYETWAAGQLGNESGQRLINGLFNVAKEIDPERMFDAFKRGVDRR